MRKFVAVSAAALVAAGAMGATAAPAFAQRFHNGGFHSGFRGGYRGGWRGSGWGYLGAFALGAGLAGPYYGYGPGYYGCAHRVWDPYDGVWVIRYYC